jgi:hypothetical protein
MSRLIISLSVFILLFGLGDADAQRRDRIEFHQLLSLLMLPEREISNVLPWEVGSERSTPIRWEHAGIKDCPPHVEKEFGSVFCRTGRVIVMVRGKPTHTHLGRTVEPSAWKITFMGARAGAFYASIDSDQLSGDIGCGLLRDALRSGKEFRLKSTKKCGHQSSGSELFQVWSPGKRPAYIRESWSCGSGGCSVDLVMTTSDASANLDPLNKCND